MDAPLLPRAPRRDRSGSRRPDRARRALNLASAGLLLLAGLPLASQASSDWRPPHRDTLAALDVEMAPTLAMFKPSLDALVRDINTVAYGATISTPAGTVESAEAVVAAAHRMVDDLGMLRGLATAGVGILDRNPPDPCWGGYWATTMTGWLLVGDATQSVDAGDLSTANRQIGGAAYLLGDYGDLAHAAAVTDCSSRN